MTHSGAPKPNAAQRGYPVMRNPQPAARDVPDDEVAMRPSDQCSAINPERRTCRCVLAQGHGGQFHRSYLTTWRNDV